MAFLRFAAGEHLWLQNLTPQDQVPQCTLGLEVWEFRFRRLGCRV